MREGMRLGAFLWVPGRCCLREEERLLLCLPNHGILARRTLSRQEGKQLSRWPPPVVLKVALVCPWFFMALLTLGFRPGVGVNRSVSLPPPLSVTSLSVASPPPLRFVFHKVFGGVALTPGGCLLALALGALLPPGVRARVFRRSPIPPEGPP